MKAVHRLRLTAMIVGIGLLARTATSTSAQERKPQMLVLWGDDIGTGRAFVRMFRHPGTV